MTEASIGYGSKFRSSNSDSPGVFTEFGEVVSITPPNPSRDSIDASHMQSPGQSREFIPGMKDGGEVSIEFNLIPAGLTALMAEYAQVGNAAVYAREIEYPDGSIWAFDAFLTGLETEAPLDDKMTGTATFKITGAPVFAAAA